MFTVLGEYCKFSSFLNWIGSWMGWVSKLGASEIVYFGGCAEVFLGFNPVSRFYSCWCEFEGLLS